MTNLPYGYNLSPAACRGYYNSKRLNGSKITDFQVTGNIDDDDIIISYYSCFTGMSHGWVVFRIKEEKTFRCHLVGIPGTLLIRVEDSNWKPGEYKVSTLKQELSWKIMKSHIRVVIKDWGNYLYGLHDCRHFARDVHRYLQRHCDN